MHFTKIASALAALATPTFANLMVTNWCQNDVTAWQSHNGGCNAGPNGICSDQPGAAPYTIAAGRTTLSLPLIDDAQGTSIKISNGAVPGFLQYEYTISNSILFWDLSNIDGAGAATAGSPFYNQNVKLTPTGNGVGDGPCTQLKCPAGQVCDSAYNSPDEFKTRACPASTGDMWLDLCEPDPWFQKRARDFSPAVKRNLTATENTAKSWWKDFLNWFHKRDDSTVVEERNLSDAENTAKGWWKALLNWWH